MDRSAVSTGAAVGVVIALVISVGAASFLGLTRPSERVVTITGSERVVTTTGPGSVVTRTLTHTLTATPDFLLSQVVEGAKNERKVVVYLTYPTEHTEQLIGLFKKLHPFMEVEFVRAASNTLIDRAVAEIRGGRFLFDVFTCPTLCFPVLRQQGVEFTKYERANSNFYPPEARAVLKFEGIAHIDRSVPLVVAYNTKLVKPEEVSKYADLAAPKWRGKLGIPGPLTHLTTLDWFLAMKEVMRDQWKPWVEGIVKNEPKFYVSLTPVAKGIVLGEAPLGLTLLNDLLLQKSRGQPIEAAPLSPSYALTTASAISPRPPHPFSAKLWLEFLASLEAQQLFVEQGNISARREGVSLSPEAQGFIGAVKILPIPAFTPEEEKQGAEELKSLGFK